MHYLGVVGNISFDRTVYPDGRQYSLVGGAALHVAIAATRAGQPADPISVIGDDLAWIIDDPRFTLLDFGNVRITKGRSCSFLIIYDESLQLRKLSSDFGVSAALTAHALQVLGPHSHYHICCRQPLDVRQVLEYVVKRRLSFSVDFHVTSAQRNISELLSSLPHAEYVFVNADEFKVLSRYANLNQLKALIVSDGERAVRLFRHGKLICSLEPNKVSANEVTGAGDILAGTFLAQWIAGADGVTALRHAIDAASEWTRGKGFLVLRSE